MDENLGKILAKIKLFVDGLIGSFSNSYKILFAISELCITTPKDLCDTLNMAKSNLAILASKLRLQKYIEQHKDETNQKHISYSITELGKSKLQAKLKKIGAKSPVDTTTKLITLLTEK